ncbi:hypothetical protein T040910_009 [Synechococcus phage S-CAM3]|uniref:Uncharacterized protein n=1 Tax=Synechococcus phage S-CAM3 TaxID=1883366 RepID=A0A1D8KJE8_9CAUD|nr:hypothetical protein T040910_009 [Synechococcus phage S-CAM3]
MKFNTPAPQDIVRWYRAGVPGGGQRDHIFDRLKAKITGKKAADGTHYFKMHDRQLSDKDADIIIANMKQDEDGYPMLETGSTSGEDERRYQEWIIERYLPVKQASSTEGFTDTTVSNEQKEEAVEEEAEEVVEKAEEEVKENIEEAAEVVDEALEDAPIEEVEVPEFEASKPEEPQEEQPDLSDIVDLLPPGMLAAVNQQTGSNYEKTPKKQKASSGAVSNTKILSTLTTSLDAIAGTLSSIDGELKKQNVMLGEALGSTVTNLQEIETSHEGLNSKFDAILGAFQAQTAAAEEALEDAKREKIEAAAEQQTDTAGTFGLGKLPDPSKFNIPGFLKKWARDLLGKLWKRFAPKKLRAITRLFRTKVARLLSRFAPKNIAKQLARKAFGTTAEAGRRGVGRAVTRKALQVGGRKLAQSAAVQATQQFVKKAALGLMRPIFSRIPIFGGLIDFAVSLMLGEDPGRAAAKAIGATIGAALGTFIPIPIAGTIIGGVVGDLVGGGLYDAITGGKPSEPTGDPQATESGAPTSFADQSGGLGTPDPAPPQQKETGGLTKPGWAIMHGTEAIVPADQYESGTENQDMAGKALSPIGGALIAASSSFLTQAGPAAALVAPMFKQVAGSLTNVFDVPATLAQTNVGGSFAGIDTAVKEGKKKAIEPEDDENINPDEFGPEGGTVKEPESLLEKMKGGITNFFGGALRLFGITMPPEVDVGNDTGDGGSVGGDGKFIQGNSGASYGIHFHIAPGSYEDGNITDPSGNADARAVAEKVINHYKGKKSIYIGRLGYTVKESDTPAIIKEKVKRGQEVHTAGGSQGGIDLQIGGAYMPGAKVPFPLNTEGMQYRQGGFGVVAKVSGSNASVAHGLYDEKGNQAPQEGEAMYGKGGDTPSVPTQITVGDRGSEKVMKNMVASFRPVSDMLDAYNASTTTTELIQATKQYAPEILMYDDTQSGGDSQPVIIIQQTPPQPAMSRGGSTIIGGGRKTNTTKTLVMQKLLA